MTYSYAFPDEAGRLKKCNTENNAVVIIGANGAGKSKLGAWIEQHDMKNVHRIGGQRSLNFKESITLKSYSQAEDSVFYGSAELTDHMKNKKFSRWSQGKGYTTTLLTDFEDVLSALIALTNNDNDNYVTECKRAEQMGVEKPHTHMSPIDKLFDIWNKVFPQRKLRIEDSKFKTFLEREGKILEYSSNQMSDGERAVLYLSAQVLCIPKGKTLIIDEPELHLHDSIMNRLWNALESVREDCLFIYITHDTGFAAMHPRADKFWVQEYDGNNWKIEKIETDDSLPEELLLRILGSRKDVLFVEGTSTSDDTQLYSQLYPDYYIVPCGSCSQVIIRTKAFKSSPMLHHNRVYGLIDRDFRSEYEIESYKKDNVYVLKVAEVENLFLVEGLIRVIAENQGLNADEVFEKVKHQVIHISFQEKINQQICQCVVARIKYKLETTYISNRSETEAKQGLEELITSFNYDDIKKEEELKFRNALLKEDYSAVIKLFNEKTVSSGIERILGLSPKTYRKLVLRKMNGNLRNEIEDAIAPYLPAEIPR